jgi:hypothetical protein
MAESFLPVLQNVTDLTNGALSRPLVPGGAMRVAFAHRAGSGLAYLTSEEAGRRRLSIEGTEHLARQALIGRPGRPGWTTIRSAVGCWLERAGDAHTSADVLDRNLIADAEQALGSTDLAAIIPTRSFLAVAPPPLADLLAVIAARLHRAAVDTGTDPLTPQVLHVQDGEIVGVVDAAPTISVAQAPAAAPEGDGTQPIQDNGTARFQINAGSVDEVGTMAEAILATWLPRLVREDWFKGLVVIVCNGYLLAPTDENREAMSELADRLSDQGAWKSLTARNGKTVTVRLRVDA